MTTSAPRLFTSAALPALVVVATIAPRCLANWIANVPTPPEPAWMKTFCSFRSWPTSTSACQAVKATRGRLAASCIVRPLGLCARDATLTGASSANVPMRMSSARA